MDDIFLAARDRTDPTERRRYLEEACAGDASLRIRVEAMLDDAEGAEAFFARVEHSTAVRTGTWVAEREGPGTTIGRYRLIEKLGEGGMGVVYRAEQQEPVRRRVALKIIRLGMDTGQVVARFEAERQALALMDHPNIAKVLDGGATETGRPFFVMELVEGVPITEFCRKHGLSLEERLRLFISVCRAVQHAHQKGIIHRDLKPSNVIVSVGDGPNEVGVPKVIDFGVAKATHQRLTEKTYFTQHAVMIGTPAYMSPEQAEMGDLDVDTRADIYSLGVLLYEILTETQPFPEERLQRVSYAEMQRIIVHEGPERPSTRLRKTALGHVTGHRTLGLRDSRLPADLDWIVLKCLEKDRNRRYETSNGLAADLDRFLHREPVAARPPGRWYEFRKTVQRHQVGFVAATAVVAALAVGSAVSLSQAARANRERALAERRLQATMELLSVAFSNAVPELSYTIGASKPRLVLTKAGARIAEELLRDAEPGTEMREVLGQLYKVLLQGQVNYVGTTSGEFAEGLQSATQAVRFLQPPAGQRPSDEQMHQLAEAEMWATFAARGLMAFDEAFAHLDRMRDWAGRLASSTNAVFADRGVQKLHWVRWMRGDTLEQIGRVEEALTAYHLPLLEELLAEKDDAPDEFGRSTRVWDLRDSFNSVGRCLLRLGRSEQAVGYLRRAVPYAEDLVARQPVHSAAASMLAESKARLGEALLSLDQPGEALPLLEDALRRAEYLRRCDPPNPGFVQTHVVVLQSKVSGYLRWARTPSAAPSERAERLDRAQEALDRAEELVASVASAAFRALLHAILQPTADALRDASVNGLLPVGSSDQAH